MPSQSMSDRELRALAVEVSEKRVFGSWELRPDEVHLHFLPLLFMTEAQCKAVFRDAGKDSRVFVYGYMHEAFPRAVNGKPVFGAMRVLYGKDFDMLMKYVMALHNERSKFLSKAKRRKK